MSLCSVIFFTLSTFRPSSPRRSRLCLVSWAEWRWFYAQQPGPSDTLANMDLNHTGLGHLLLGQVLKSTSLAQKLCGLVTVPWSPLLLYIKQDYFGRCPGTIRPKCSSTIGDNAFRSSLKCGGWLLSLTMNEYWGCFEINVIQNQS